MGGDLTGILLHSVLRRPLCGLANRQPDAKNMEINELRDEQRIVAESGSTLNLPDIALAPADIGLAIGSIIVGTTGAKGVALDALGKTTEANAAFTEAK